MEKSQMNVTNVTMHPLVQTVWRDIWKHMVDKVKQMQQTWLCLFSGRQFEETFDNTLRRKVKLKWHMESVESATSYILKDVLWIWEGDKITVHVREQETM